MKAGKLIHTIRIQTSTSTPDEYRTPVETWTDRATLRAEVIQRSTEEFLRPGGAADEVAIIFRTWFLDSVTNADRVIFEGQAFNIREVTRIGRRTGLELRCMALEEGA